MVAGQENTLMWLTSTRKGRAGTEVLCSAGRVTIRQGIREIRLSLAEADEVGVLVDEYRERRSVREATK